MTRLFHCVDGQWSEHSHPPVFALHGGETGDAKLLATAPAGDPSVLRQLASCLAPPYLLLYILHTPRGEGESGRYQSPELSAAELDGFFDRFGPFLQNDARYDL